MLESTISNHCEIEQIRPESHGRIVTGSQKVWGSIPRNYPLLYCECIQYKVQSRPIRLEYKPDIHLLIFVYYS